MIFKSTNSRVPFPGTKTMENGDVFFIKEDLSLGRKLTEKEIDKLVRSSIGIIPSLSNLTAWDLLKDWDGGEDEEDGEDETDYDYDSPSESEEIIDSEVINNKNDLLGLLNRPFREVIRSILDGRIKISGRLLNAADTRKLEEHQTLFTSTIFSVYSSVRNKDNVFEPNSSVSYKDLI
ncbi:hypothetical protein [Chitinivibrio alkaliphilus]|uniref:Uncharacterized protein n=1 Tax=Chitinivibrio alkaliphilus ACht1 TaxID=1313304 RepID=U7D6M7_9BACT|nr:hypothetical protein [Chitinivibrio alkaliphilus]ERP30737.1 hypothetical protein CALK_2427 [Chitinivibrio alkaliphilus ACht1]